MKNQRFQSLFWWRWVLKGDGTEVIIDYADSFNPCFGGGGF